MSSSVDAVEEKPREEVSPRLEKIPLGKIMPHPENPRGPVDPAEAQAMEGSLRESGQKTPLKLRPLSEEDKARFTPFEYLLLGGHVRLEGAKLAGFEALLALVYPPRTEDEEELDMVLDNQWTGMSWWKWDLIIERRAKRHPGLSRRKLAAQLKFSHTRINRALKIMATLNPAAREAIAAHLALGGVPPSESGTPGSTQDKVFLITEAHLEVLADLKAPPMVEKAVKITLDRKLTESQAKKLVEWGQSGQDLAAYEPAAKEPKAKPTPKGAKPVGNPPDGPKPSAQRPQADGQALSVPVLGMEATTSQNGTGSQPPTQTGQSQETQPKGDDKGSLSNLALGEMAGISPISRIKAKLKKGEKLTRLEGLFLAAHWTWEKLLWIGKHWAKPALEGLWKAVKWVFHGVWGILKKAAKVIGKPFGKVGEQLAEWAVWGLVIGFGIWLFLNWWHGINSGRILKGWAMWPITKVESWFEPTLREPKSPKILKGNDANGTKASETDKVVEPPSKAPGVADNKTRTSSPKHKLQPPMPQVSEPVPAADPEEMNARVEADSPRALRFAGTFYGTSYQDMDEWMGYFNGVLAGDHLRGFYSDFFPPTRIQEIQRMKLMQTFQPSGPVKLLRADQDTDDFLVEGTVTTQEELDPTARAADTVPVSLVVGFGRDGKVYKVEPKQ